MGVTLHRWDSVEHLKTEEDIALYFEACVEEAGDDAAFIAKALGNITRALGMTQLAKDTGMGRESLYSDALEHSRYLALILSDHTQGRPWVIQEWTSWMAGHGPLGRLLPLRIDAVNLPFILSATQAIDATDRDAGRAATALFGVVGNPARLPPEDRRRLVLGREPVFVLAREDDGLRLTDPDGETRRVPMPEADHGFRLAWRAYRRLQRIPLEQGPERTEIVRQARTLGGLLFRTLFDGRDRLPRDPRRTALLRSRPPRGAALRGRRGPRRPGPEHPARPSAARAPARRALAAALLLSRQSLG